MLFQLPSNFVKVSRLAAHRSCPTHSLVQVKNEKVPSRKGTNALPCWEALVRTMAWWHSRVQLVGPQQEKTELLYFPATEETGLHRVHPT